MGEHAPRLPREFHRTGRILRHARAPEGRYIAPANSGDCIQVRGGDCGLPRSLLIRAPWFVRLDAGATKRFKVGESKDFEVRFDMLNMFANPGTAASIFR